MRQGCFLLCLSVVLTFLGCKEDDLEVHSGLVRETQTVYPTYTTNSRTFDYDETGKLISVETELGAFGSYSENYFYNSNGGLIKYEASDSEVSIDVDLIYEENLLIMSIKNSSSFALGRIRTISSYSYNTDNQRIAQIDTIINNTFLPDTSIFNWQFLYNSLGNRINEKKFDEGGNLLIENQVEFDDKTNPFFGKNYDLHYGLSYFTNPNNVLRLTRTSNGSTNIRIFHYTYDHTGFPITIREGTDDDFLQITYK